ncbi:metallophosphoesterase, partial [Desulfobacterales bacterium HSG17]|nr:metallophosphoesterase [Desulfobacterales bacterium HSG17]
NKKRRVMTMKNRILIISDTHFPFAINGYLKFVKKVYKKYNCNLVIHTGDLIDQHAISFHETEPDSMGFESENKLARKEIKRLAKTFPRMKICLGNHDMRLYRVAAKKAGIPVRCMKSLEELYDLPRGWELGEEFYIDGIKFVHGEGYSGMTGHINNAKDSRQSTVMGHLHSFAGVSYLANNNELIFGMNAGCLIDANVYAMRYGKKFKFKPTVACGVIIDGTPHLEHMDLGNKVIRED